MAAFCTSCGARLANAAARFCAECGAPILRPAATVGGAPVPSPQPPTHAAPAAATPGSPRPPQRHGFERISHPRGHSVVVGACRKDAHDPNDRHYDTHQNVDPAELPAFVDLREWMTPVEDQGELGSCTANAIAGAYEYLEKRTTGREGDVSRLFIYYLERKLEGTEGEDCGASLRNGMKVLKSYGACSERTWPYHVDRFAHEPHSSAFAEAERHTVDEYRRVPVELHAMKSCLAEGYPFVFGAKIYRQFEKDGHHGRISMPRGDDLGGHAMLACGYSDRDRVFVVRNSWGNDWGDEGYCYIPYDYLTDPEETHDCWTVRRAHNLDFPQSAEHPRLSFFDAVVALVDEVAGQRVATDEENQDENEEDQNQENQDESEEDEDEDDEEADEEADEEE